MQSNFLLNFFYFLQCFAKGGARGPPLDPPLAADKPMIIHGGFASGQTR